MSENEEADVQSEAFLARWSRRKSEEQVLQESEVRDSESPPQEHPPVLADADMPSLESLGPDSDYSGFLSPEVSQGLRRLALRKLFHSAGFNVRDGLDDYDQDFTEFTGLGELVTREMRRRLELEALRLEQRQAEDSAIECNDEVTASEAGPASPSESAISEDGAIEALGGEKESSV